MKTRPSQMIRLVVALLLSMSGGTLPLAPPALATPACTCTSGQGTISVETLRQVRTLIRDERANREAFGR